MDAQLFTNLLLLETVSSSKNKSVAKVAKESIMIHYDTSRKKPVWPLRKYN